jgi:hypothetical protein
VACAAETSALHGIADRPAGATSAFHPVHRGPGDRNSSASSAIAKRRHEQAQADRYGVILEKLAAQADGYGELL